MEQNHHYYLVTGEVVFTDDGAIHSTNVNGIIVLEENRIPVSELGKAQQILQLNFFKQMNNESLEIQNVVLSNFSYLGKFSKDDFHDKEVDKS